MARRVPLGRLGHIGDLCAAALVEARRQIADKRFGPVLGRLLARVSDLLDEMDEILVGLHPARDHESFVRVAELHRNLEEIQSLVPRNYRCFERGSRLK